MLPNMLSHRTAHCCWISAHIDEVMNCEDNTSLSSDSALCPHLCANQGLESRNGGLESKTLSIMGMLSRIL